MTQEKGVLPPPDRELLERFVENQGKDLAVRAQELEIEKQKDNNSLEFGKLSLAAQERDRTHDRECGRKVQRDRLIAVLTVVLIFAALVFAALQLNKDAIAMELVKAVILVSAGAAGGYGYAKSSARNAVDSPPTKQDP
jgi:Flp pilus assembly protein TadB